jgi:hypothetical protein
MLIGPDSWFARLRRGGHTNDAAGAVSRAVFTPDASIPTGADDLYDACNATTTVLRTLKKVSDSDGSQYANVLDVRTRRVAAIDAIDAIA